MQEIDYNKRENTNSYIYFESILNVAEQDALARLIFGFVSNIVQDLIKNLLVQFLCLLKSSNKYFPFIKYILAINNSIVLIKNHFKFINDRKKYLEKILIKISLLFIKPYFWRYAKIYKLVIHKNLHPISNP